MFLVCATQNLPAHPEFSFAHRTQAIVPKLKHAEALARASAAFALIQQPQHEAVGGGSASAIHALHVTMAANASSSSANDSASVIRTPAPSASASASASASSSSSVKTWTTDARDSCRWYGGVPCDRPRTCYDCLNVRLMGQECAVDAAGACVPIAEYEAFMRTRSSYPADYTYYPSTNATYCGASDAMCASCSTRWLSQQGSSSASSAANSCIGAGGCVCVKYCELPGWTESVLERNHCLASPSPASRGAGTTVDSDNTSGIDRQASLIKLLTALAIGLGLCAVFTVIALGVRYVVRALEAAAELARLNRRRLPRREPSGPQLGLDGWKAMLQELIESEREQLAETGGERPQVVLANETAAAAPVLIEQGDGYRPASPSALDRHHRLG